MDLLVIITTSAQFTGCDYFQNVLPGQTYDVFSPGYGNNYQSGINCRMFVSYNFKLIKEVILIFIGWRAQGPVNSKLVLNCIDVIFPEVIFLVLNYK